jgi:hypothetical protein
MNTCSVAITSIILISVETINELMYRYHGRDKLDHRDRRCVGAAYSTFHIAVTILLLGRFLSVGFY